MNPKKFNVKDEKGSITLFVVIAILFFLIILFGRVYSTSNLNTAQLKEVEQIQKQYTVTDDDLDRAYRDALGKEHKLKVGDFVNYELSALDDDKVATLNSDVNTYSGADSTQTISRTDTTNSNGKDYLLCRVLEVDQNGNPTKLISANGINSLGLKGANGYNNAVYLINEMCEILYSGKQGTTTSLTIDELEQRYFDPTALATAKGNTYGTTTYYASNAKYPNIALEEAGMGIGTTLVDGKNTIREGGLGLSEQTTTYTGNGDAATLEATKKGITTPITFYAISAEDSNYKSTILNSIIHQNTLYWLASRSVYGSSDFCSFSVFRVDSHYVRGAFTNNAAQGSLFSSLGNAVDLTYKVRPVITLNSGTQAEYVGTYNSTYNLWNLN